MGIKTIKVNFVGKCKMSVLHYLYKHWKKKPILHVLQLKFCKDFLTKSCNSLLIHVILGETCALFSTHKYTDKLIHNHSATVFYLEKKPRQSAAILVHGFGTGFRMV